eukprot:365028-Chlamydomonas_euryale.AAC.32
MLPGWQCHAEPAAASHPAAATSHPAAAAPHPAAAASSSAGGSRGAGASATTGSSAVGGNLHHACCGCPGTHGDPEADADAAAAAAAALVGDALLSNACMLRRLVAAAAERAPASSGGGVSGSSRSGGRHTPRLRIAYVLPHARVTGGLKLLCAHVSMLRRRGHHVVAVRRAPAGSAGPAVPPWSGVSADEDVLLAPHEHLAGVYAGVNTLDVVVVGMFQQVWPKHELRGSGSQPAMQSASHAASQPCSQPAMQSASHAASQPCSQPAMQ